MELIEGQLAHTCFGLLKRGVKVYTKIIMDASSQTLMPIIERKVFHDSIVYSDGCITLSPLSGEPL